MPKSADLYNKIKNTISGDKVENAIHDLKNTWMIISCSALIAIVVRYGSPNYPFNYHNCCRLSCLHTPDTSY